MRKTNLHAPKNCPLIGHQICASFAWAQPARTEKLPGELATSTSGQRGAQLCPTADEVCTSTRSRDTITALEMAG